MFKVENKDLEHLINIEYNNALRYAKYHSNHEFYGVIKEEIEEADDDMKEIEAWTVSLWNNIKTDDLIEEDKQKIKENAYNCIKELIQVLAVIKKSDIGVNE